MNVYDVYDDVNNDDMIDDVVPVDLTTQTKFFISFNAVSVRYLTTQTKTLEVCVSFAVGNENIE